jgi:hypothetical protein
MPPARLEPTITASERLQTHALRRAATETINISYILHRGYTVAQLVEALRYKPEGRGFDSRWYHWKFSLT